MQQTQTNVKTGRQEEVQKRRNILLLRFSPEDYFRPIQQGHMPAVPFIVIDVDERSVGREYKDLLNRPLNDREVLLLLDPATLRCYSYFALCSDMRTAKRAALAKKKGGNLQEELEKIRVLMHTDYPFEAIYEHERSPTTLLVGFNGRAEGDILEASRCVYVRVDVEAMPQGIAPEVYVENTLKSVLGSKL